MVVVTQQYVLTNGQDGKFYVAFILPQLKKSGISALPEQGSSAGSLRAIPARFLGQRPAHS